MKAVIRWAVNNAPAMNTIMVAALAMGIFSIFLLRSEVFPNFDIEIVLVNVPYPGATPEEVEEGICQKIEEAIRSIDGIKKQTSVAAEGAGHVVLELETGAPVQKILNEVRSEVDRIPSFPENAEDPRVSQITLRQPAIRVALIGPDVSTPEAELKLREEAEQLRARLLLLESVSTANIMGERAYQIDVEIPEERLRKYGLTLKEVARTIRRENVELPGGTIKTEAGDFLVRGKNKRSIGEEIAELPLLTDPRGVVLTVGDIGEVRDEFTDATAISRVNGQPGIVISVDRTENEDLIEMVTEVRGFLENYEVPEGYSAYTFNDTAVDVKDRIELLARSGLQGLLLVFIVLAIFLEIRLAFWVSLGIPIAVLGACAVLLGLGQTINMLSMFGFMMALGIVVDDAIVIGENIHAHRQQGKDFVTAAIDGTVEVIPAVAASVTTTVIAFLPLMFVAGVTGKFVAVLPLAVIAMLVISLFEAIFILPVHLAHDDKEPIGGVFEAVNRGAAGGLQWFIDRVYSPALTWSIRHPLAIAASGAGILMIAFSLLMGGVLPFEFFPKFDTKYIFASVEFPNGTPAAVTKRATDAMEEAILEINEQHSRGEEEPLIQLTHTLVGGTHQTNAMQQSAGSGASHVGSVFVELSDPSFRDLHSEEVLALWREKYEQRNIAGSEEPMFAPVSMGPAGEAIKFKVIAEPEHMRELEEVVVEELKRELGRHPGVTDISDDSKPGKYELQVLGLKEAAQSTDVQTADLVETVRSAFYGEEVMRLQRGRHEVKLMVRYPADERRSMANFQEIRVPLANGDEMSIQELANVELERGYSEINRLAGRRSITITADVNEKIGNSNKITSDLKNRAIPKLQEQHPFFLVRWEGKAEEQKETFESMGIGFGIALLAMYVLLTLMFRSYFQPMLILMIIPFGAVGAVIGHLILGIPFSFFSVFGLIALSGVVVNDSIVLIDFINQYLDEGHSLNSALIEAGRRRFRPVLLTSCTTVAGLFPILMETSFQAQILIPMATSLCFGLLMATVLVLILVPTFFSLYGRLFDVEAEHRRQRAAEEREAAEEKLAAAPA